MSDALRLVIYDSTCVGRRFLPGLSDVWRTGTRLFGALGQFDAWQGAATWSEALDWLAHVEPERPIAEIQYWGHGRWGRALLAGEPLDASALRPDHALGKRLYAVRERLDRAALFWFRCCEIFGTDAGHSFARAWTDFLGCRAAGHTYIIHALQSGLHSLAPGETPRWPTQEGVPPGIPAPRSALSSRLGAVNTITMLEDRLPSGF